VRIIIISAVKRVEIVTDRMSYKIQRNSLCHIIVLNVHASTEDKTDERMSYKLPRGSWCHIIVLNIMQLEKIKLMM
jgi:phosphatidylethanolamine-binding protein (PEBP) family uncharacterized protein